MTPDPSLDAEPSGALFSDRFEIFLACPPGLERTLLAEARELGFPDGKAEPGGVCFLGGWPDVWRANLMLRGASRVTAQLARFPAAHLAQLDKRARRLPWPHVFKLGTPVRVDASCKASRIYHSGAAEQRVRAALEAVLGAPTSDQHPQRVTARIERNICTLSADTSGELLHKRGYKAAVGKAPLRETMAAMFLRAAGFTGEESVVDPMCGSGTIVLEAAAMALNRAPGRSRAFAFEGLARFDAGAWAALSEQAAAGERATAARFFGFDRDAGAVAMSAANAARADLSDVTTFAQAPLSALQPPDGPPGLVMTNPPYGARIGDRGGLVALYAAFGRVLQERFSGWRAAMITSEPSLAKATGLPFRNPGPATPHGSIRIRLYQTGPLA